MYPYMNPIELQQTIQKAVDAKMSGQDRLAKLLAHQINCLLDSCDSLSMQQLLHKLGIDE